MEILIALFVFLIGILGVLSMFPVAMSSAGRAIGEVRANLLAQTALAQLTSDCTVPYEQGTAEDNSSVPPAPDNRWTRQEQLKRSSSESDWSGYYVTLLDGPGQWQSRLITGIDPTDNTILQVYPPWTPLTVPVSYPPGTDTWVAPGDLSDPDDYPDQRYVVTRLGLPDPPAYAAAPREGFVRMFAAGTTDTFHAGLAAGTAADSAIDPLDTTNSNWSNYTWSMIANQTAAGGGTNYIDAAGSLAGGSYAHCRLVLTGGKGAGQMRWVSADTDATATEHRLFVSEDWDSGKEPDGTTEYAIFGPHYLLITSGRAAGRLYVITADAQDATNGHTITCAGANFAEDGVTEACRPTDTVPDYLRVRATQFAVLGNMQWVRTVPLRSKPSLTFSGTATALAPVPPEDWIQDSRQAWPTNMFRGWRVRLTAGTGAGQLGVVTDNLGDTLTVDPVWTVSPDLTTRYEIIPPDPFTGTATAATGAPAPSLSDSNQAWATDAFKPCWILLVNGTGRGQLRQITANTDTLLSIAPDWTVLPQPDTEYAIMELNTFGIPTAPQTGGDVYFHGALEQEASEYSVACVFTDDPALPKDLAHPVAPERQVKLDVFVFRNFDINQNLLSNRKAVGYITGYIERP